MSGRAAPRLIRLGLPLWLALLAGCGGQADSAAFSCDRDPPLSYDNFGEGFLSTHCEGCHSVLNPAGLREGAPLEAHFSSYADVLAWAERIERDLKQLVVSHQ